MKHFVQSLVCLLIGIVSLSCVWYAPMKIVLLLTAIWPIFVVVGIQKLVQGVSERRNNRKKKQTVKRAA